MGHTLPASFLQFGTTGRPRGAHDDFPARNREIDYFRCRWAAVCHDEGSHLGRGPVIRRLPGRTRGQRPPHGDREQARRAAVIAATAQALAGQGGMPGLLWSRAWLTEGLAMADNCPDETSFSDTTPLTKIGPACASRRARMRKKFQRALVAGNVAA